MSSLSDIERQHVDIEASYNETDLERFMRITFPRQWAPLIARILETGAVYEETSKFAPKWSTVPFMERKGSTDTETQLKSVLFRVHDCLHQLWGLPIPEKFDEDDRREFKKMWMCAEVAVFTISEFFYAQWLYDTQPYLRDYLEKRNTLLFKNAPQMRNLSIRDTMMMVDHLLHQCQKKQFDAETRYSLLPDWVKKNKHAMIFVEDFSAMLRQDRVNIDCNWALLLQQKDKSYLQHIPNQSYSRQLEGLQLTLWMADNFENQLNTGLEVDRELAMFNQERRRKVNLPDGWNEGKMPDEL